MANSDTTLLKIDKRKALAVSCENKRRSKLLFVVAENYLQAGDIVRKMAREDGYNLERHPAETERLVEDGFIQKYN